MACGRVLTSSVSVVSSNLDFGVMKSSKLTMTTLRGLKYALKLTDRIHNAADCSHGYVVQRHVKRSGEKYRGGKKMAHFHFSKIECHLLSCLYVVLKCSYTNTVQVKLLL